MRARFHSRMRRCCVSQRKYLVHHRTKLAFLHQLGDALHRALRIGRRTQIEGRRPLQRLLRRRSQTLIRPSAAALARYLPVGTAAIATVTGHSFVHTLSVPASKN